MAAAIEPPMPLAESATVRQGKGVVSGTVLDDNGNAVKGAILVLRSKARNYRRSARSDAKGHYSFPGLASSDYHLTVRAAGFASIQRDLKVHAEQPETQDFNLAVASATIVVQEELHAPVEQGALAQDIVKTETISMPEIVKTGATTLTDAVTHRPGIDIQVECSICNVRSITLDNLPGRYTTLTLDGVPVFSPVSNAYGLDMVGVNGLERIDVSRGAGSSLTTPESLAGTVTLVTRTPTKDSVEGDVSAGDYGYQRQAVYAAKVFDWGAISVSGTHQEHDNVDGIGYGISQFTGYKRNLEGVGLYLNDLGGFKVKARFDHIEEKRMGGPLGDDYDAVLADTTGNPFNWSAGPHGSPSPAGWIDESTGTIVPYNGGEYGMAEIIFTYRNQFVATADRFFGDTRLHFGLGYAEHAQNSWYGDDSNYWDHQKQGYLDANLQSPLAGILFTLGLNYKYEGLHSDSQSEDPSSPWYQVLRQDVDAYTYQTPGIYLQGYGVYFDDRLEVNASLREDDNNQFGGITTPRLNVLWHHSSKLSSRLAVGTGYRLPTSFFEQDHGILSDFTVDRSQAKPERSTNASYALNYADDRMAITGSLNHTRIDDMAMFVDADSYNNTTANFVLEPAQHPFTVNNADIVGTWKATPRDAITLGLEGYLYTFNSLDAYFADLFSRPEYRASLSYDRDAGPWDFNVRATLTGPQNLAKWYDYADNPRFNLDGTPKITKSPNFWVVDMHTSYQFTKFGSAYLGVTNITNYQQAKHDSYFFCDPYGDLNWTHIWGPGIGRQFVVGAKFNF